MNIVRGSFLVFPPIGNRRQFQRIEDAERFARRATERLGGERIAIRQNGHEVAVCMIDALGRTWTDLTSTGATLL